jgi:hypothetical protein
MTAQERAPAQMGLSWDAVSTGPLWDCPLLCCSSLTLTPLMYSNRSVLNSLHTTAISSNSIQTLFGSTLLLEQRSFNFNYLLE